jgi:trigger factor
MSIQIENLGALKRKVRIVFPVEEIMVEKAYRLKQIAQNFTRPGFRRGKVPMSMIEKELGEQLNQEAAANKAGSLFFDICKDQKIEVAGKPNFKEEKLEEQRYAFDVEFEVMPQVAVLSADHFKDLEFKEYQCTIDDQEIDKAVELLQKMIGGTKELPADHIIQASDVVHLTFKDITVDGEQKIFLPLNEELKMEMENLHSPIRQALDQLSGKTIGEHHLEYVNTSSDEALKPFLDKTIKMHVMVNKVSTHVLAELNEDFFKKVGAADMPTLRQDMQKNLELQVKNNVKTLGNKQIIRAIRSLELDVPQNMLEEQSKKVREDAFEELKKKPSMTTMHRILGADALALSQLKLTFFFSEFVKANQITVSPESIRTKINEIASTYENPEEIKRLCLQNQEMIEGLQTNILEELAFDKIKELLPNKQSVAVTVEGLAKLVHDAEAQDASDLQKLVPANLENNEQQQSAPVFASAEPSA